MYREQVESEKRSDLHELEGKTLACFCSVMKRCHGNVLIYLLAKHTLKNERLFDEYLYGGDLCVLSNSFLMKFVSADKPRRKFTSLAHAYYYFCAEKSAAGSEMLGAILKSTSLKEASTVFAKCMPTPVLIDLTTKVLLLYKLLLLKWRQSKAFRRACRSNSQLLLIQQSDNAVWGRGKGNSVKDYSGKNVGGWLLVALCENKCCTSEEDSAATSQSTLFDRMKMRLIRCTKGFVNLNLLQGAELVASALEHGED
jgi:hypothetical protein